MDVWKFMWFCLIFWQSHWKSKVADFCSAVVRLCSCPRHLSNVGCFWNVHGRKKQEGENVIWPYPFTSDRYQTSLPLTQAPCSSWKHEALCSLSVGEKGKYLLPVLWKTLLTMPMDKYIWITSFCGSCKTISKMSSLWANQITSSFWGLIMNLPKRIKLII